MPMPNGTYLQSKKPDKTAANVAAAKSLKEAVERKQKQTFERFMASKKIDLRKIKQTIDDYKKSASKPKSERARQIEALKKVLEDLDDLSDLVNSDKDLRSEIGQPAKIYSGKVKGYDVDGIDLTKFLVALVMFVMALEKFHAKLKSSR